MKFLEYIESTFARAAKDFLVNTGFFDVRMPFKDLVENLNAQADQVIEESLEFIKATSLNDKKEMVDGIVDFYFVWGNFLFMFDSIHSLLQLDEENLEIFEKTFSVKKLDLLQGLVPLVLKFKDFDVPDEQLIACAKLIVANNRLKYTDIKDEVESWEIVDDGSGTAIHETVVNGVSWYCLRDANGKVRKHKNFVKVKLEEVLGGANG